MSRGSEGSRKRSRPAALLETIAVEALALCDAGRAVERICRAGEERLSIGERTISLRKGGRLLLVAYGKAAPRMMAGLKTRIDEAGGRRTVRGLVIAPREAGRTARAKSCGSIQLLSGDHPHPGRASLTAGRRALQVLSHAGPKDDVVYLASGGGSALMAAPLAPFVTGQDKRRLHEVLIVSGAPISAINTVRKHLSAVKGGRLAVAARRAKSQMTLVLCDVNPEHYEEVASSPSMPDRTTINDMVRVIDRFGIAPFLPARVLDALRSGRLPETPKPGAAVFRRSRHRLVMSNRDLRNAAVHCGLAYRVASEGMMTEIVGSVEDGVETVARAIEGAPVGTRLLVMGGEALTIPRGGGVGGRAQEFALRLVLRMRNLSARPWAYLAFGSDGIDGNSPVAGAYVDSTTLERAGRLRLDLDRILGASDSYRLFKRLGDTFSVNPGTTVLRDLYLLLTGDAPPRGSRLSG